MQQAPAKSHQVRNWAPWGWMAAYAYIVLCIGCYASYLGASPASLIATAGLLALPNVVKVGTQTASTIEIVVHIVVALIFAAVAHIVGWGISGVLGT